MNRIERTGWQEVAEAKLAAVLAHARAHSPFHRGRIPASYDLAAVPILDKDDWLAASPPHALAALTGPLARAYVFRTGGSTGAPKFSVFSTAEFRAFTRYFKRTYRAAGLQPADRVANLFACGGLYASFIFVNRMLEETGCLNFPFTTATPPEVVAANAARFGINVLVGFPSWLLAVAETGLKVEKIFYAGEHLYPEDRAYLVKQTGATLIASAGYAAVDAGMIGYQCRAATGGVHHLLADHSHLEILDGQVVVTNLDRKLQPVIRYQVGDLARWVPGDCPCGRTVPRFELLQRGDDSLRIGYATLTYNEVLEALSGIASTIQLVKTRSERKDALSIRIETRGEPDVQRCEAALAKAKPDLGKLLQDGYMHPLTFEFLPPGGIERLPVSGKLKRVVDQS